MNHNQLKYVISVAENGSFSKAAKELYITQPSLSNQIKALEEEIGTPLFIRMHHNLKLTAAGHEFVMYSRRILNEIDNLQSLMLSYSSFAKGNLTIGTFSNACYTDIIDHIMTFQKLYPKINVSIAMDYSDKLIDMLMTQEIDVAILTSNESSLKSKDFQYIQLFKEPYVALIPQNHPLSNHSALQLENLKNEKLILPQGNSLIRSIITNTLHHEGKALKLCGECNSIAGCIQMVSNGFGISITTLSVAKALKNSSFNIIPLIPPFRLQIYIAMLKNTYPGSISDAFFSFLQTQFQ